MSSMEMDQHSMISIICNDCSVEFERPRSIFKDHEFNEEGELDDVICSCCYEGSHVIDWNYNTAEDNGCGDGCMIEGDCKRCNKTFRAEFQQKQGEDPLEV